MPAEGRLAFGDHERVGYDVLVAEHYAFRVAGGARRVDEESEIFVGVDLLSPVPGGAGGEADGGEVLEPEFWIFLVAHEDDAVFRYSDLRAGLERVR